MFFWDPCPASFYFLDEVLKPRIIGPMISQSMTLILFWQVEEYVLLKLVWKQCFISARSYQTLCNPKPIATPFLLFLLLGPFLGGFAFPFFLFPFFLPFPLHMHGRRKIRIQSHAKRSHSLFPCLSTTTTSFALSQAKKKKKMKMKMRT